MVKYCKSLQKVAKVFANFYQFLEHLFSPLGEVADRTIYFTFCNFFLFFFFNDLSEDFRNLYT